MGLGSGLPGETGRLSPFMGSRESAKSGPTGQRRWLRLQAWPVGAVIPAMEITFRLLIAALCLAAEATAAHGAVLSYTSAYRYVEGGDRTFQTTDPFSDLDVGVVGLDSTATHRSSLGAGVIRLSSRITGLTERGAAFFVVDFILDEPAAWSLTGSFELLGSNGVACISLLNLANRDAPLVHELIDSPPLGAQSRALQFGGVLPAGSYTLDALIYGGGNNQPARGGIDAVFTIPEPGAPLLLLFAVALLRGAGRRRSVNH